MVQIRKYYLSIYFTTLLLIIVCYPVQAYEFQIKSDTCYSNRMILARYAGTSLYPVDTLACQSNKASVIKNNKVLDQGLYAIIFEDQSKSDFLVAEKQVLNIHLKMESSLIAEVTGDAQSEAFSNYGNFMRKMHKQRDAAIKRYKENAKNSDSILVIRNELENLNVGVRKYYATGIKQFNGQILGSIYSVLLPVDSPKMLSQNEQRLYLKNHFFDHANFHDDKLTNTPFLINQLDVYLNEVVDQVPDSIAKYAIKVVDKSTANNDVFKLVCNHIFSYATQSKIMGMDKVQVAISKKYYLNGMAFWTNQEFRNKLQELVDKAEPVLIGKKAPEITLMSLNEDDGFVSLSDIEAKYTLVFFWEPGCYHCQQAIPYLKEATKKYSPSTFTIFAVYTQFDKQEWKDYIFEKNLFNWVHVYDKNNQSQVKNTYDVASTPMLYLLDKEKNIVAKKFDPKFLDPILKQLLAHDSL